jgi:aryl-alcohol dehydrogenase-like predicted oxidoreductase
MHGAAAALDAGLNVIDTAECHENSEELTGQAIGRRRADC